MNRHLRFITLGLLLAYSAPVIAQSFEGLDSTSSKKKKKKKKKKGEPTEEKTDDGMAPLPSTASPPAAAPAASPSSTGGTKLDMPPPPPGMTQKPLATPPPKAPPAEAKKPASPKNNGPAAPTMTFEAVDVSGKTGDRQRLDVAIGQFKNEQYDAAALTAYELMKDPKFAELQLEAHYLLAKSLYRLGMYHSSLGEFSKILAAGPDTKFFKTSLEWLFFISHKTTNESVILDEIARYSNYEFPEKFRSEFHYLLARYYFVRGRALDRAEQKQEAEKSFIEVKKNVLAIPKNDAFYVKAKYLEGLAFFQEANMASSLAAMKEVVRLTRPGGGKSAAQTKLDQEMRELSFMQLARTHYGAKQNRYAIYYYGKVERGNPQWLEALFESSWANYRIGQFEQALGNLITLSSPFFREEYFPEALILKAVIYFENCRYRESNAILEDFDHIYMPVMTELLRITQKEQDAGAYYQVLADVQKKNKGGQRTNTDLILERILKLALTDKDLKQTNDSILELEAELDSYASKPDALKYSELAKTLQDGLKQQREALIKKAGIMAKAKLENELNELRRLLADAERVKFETTTKEKTFLEEQLAKGGPSEIVKKYKFSVAVSDEQLYWPYEGEYWRDELGTYQYTLTKGCIERDSGNVRTSDGL